MYVYVFHILFHWLTICIIFFAYQIHVRTIFLMLIGQKIVKMVELFTANIHQVLWFGQNSAAIPGRDLVHLSVIYCFSSFLYETLGKIISF